MTYRSNLPAVGAKLDGARRAGLIAAATVLQNAVKRKLTGGYKNAGSRHPLTKPGSGNVRASVAISEPRLTSNRGSILVGTNVMYALYWELGFWKWPAYYSSKLGRWVSVRGIRNVRTRYRSEKWMPAFRESASAMRDAYSEAYRRSMGGGP